MGESWSKSVFSEVVSELAYDPDTQELTVTWKKGQPGVYMGVPEDHADQLSRAASVGSMIHSEFKGVYPYRGL
jgi:hypothetical protein